MPKITPKIGCSIFLLWFVGCIASCTSRFAITRVCVIDKDSGAPVAGGSVNCSYQCISEYFGGPKSKIHCYKKVGNDGVLWILGQGNAPTVSAWLDSAPKGYYKGNGAHKKFWTISYLCPLPICLPPIQTLRVEALRKQNPISLYEWHFNDPGFLQWEKRNWQPQNLVESFAFDCFVGDWCAPHGKGLTNDLVCTYTYVSSGSGTNRCGNPETYYRKERKLTFSNPNDGVQPIPGGENNDGRPNWLIAPVTGYIPEHTSFCENSHDRGWQVSKTSDSFYFRVRTTCAKDGTITGGHYGKMSGRYSVYLGMSLDYILNPNLLDTNLESNGQAIKVHRLSRHQQTISP